MRRSIRTRAVLVVLLGLVAGVAATAAPASAAATTTPLGHPRSSGHPGSDPILRARTVRPDTAWSVSISPQNTDVDVTDYVTLVATANQPVDNTGEQIIIWDHYDGAAIAVCTTGTTCYATVESDTPYADAYIPYIAASAARASDGGPTGAQAWGVAASVSWEAVVVNALTTSATTLGLGGSITLTATTNRDIESSGLSLEFFDETTGAYLYGCDSGTSCDTTVSQSSAGTHRYVAYVTFGAPTSYPPPEIEATSPETQIVTWTSGQNRVSLTGPYMESYDGGATLTATANTEVDAPYFIEIFNETTGRLLGACSGSTTCSLPDNSFPSGGDVHYVAFIATYGASLPPGGTQASSNDFDVLVHPIP